VLSGEATNTNLIVSGLTRSGFELTVNHNTNIQKLMREISIKSAYYLIDPILRQVIKIPSIGMERKWRVEIQN
jgi:hypothetical protein